MIFNIFMKVVDKRLKRQRRVRMKVRGTEERPRLSVFRSNKFIYAQIIDDGQGETILGVSEKHLETVKGMKKSEKAKALGLLLAEKALEKKVKKVVFDKGSYVYGGRIASFAEGGRQGGLKF